MDSRMNKDFVLLTNDSNTFEVEINNVPIKWEIDKGVLSFFGIPSALFWTVPSISNMLIPIVDELGKDLFRLLVANSSSLGTEQDYYAMISSFSNNFQDGFLAWGKAVSSAGWGTFELVNYNSIEKSAFVIVRNCWEISTQRNIAPEKRWGTPFLQGKLIGIFSYAFGEPCWANDVCYYDNEKPYTEIHIYRSELTILNELDKLRSSRMAAKEKLLSDIVSVKTNELQQMKNELEIYAIELEKKISARTTELVKANIELKLEIENRKAVEKKLEETNIKLLQMSNTDKLTEISNRRHFDAVLETEWNRAIRTGCSFALLIGDIDWFKKYNDTYGHQAGDQCLKLVAKTLHNNARRVSDLVARYGGEEFAIILPVTTREEACTVVEHIIQDLRNLYLPHSGSTFGYVTMSFGVTISTPQLHKSIEDLISETDKSLYKAKMNGRNQYALSTY